MQTCVYVLSPFAPTPKHIHTYINTYREAQTKALLHTTVNNDYNLPVYYIILIDN